MTGKEVDLCNGALLLLGAKRISGLDENSLEAVTCKQFYERSYRALLNNYPYRFAQKYADLVAIADEVPEDSFYKTVFRLPQDMISLIQMVPNQDSFKIVGNTLYSTYKEAKIRYTFRVPEELMTPIYEQAFMYYLASQICITVTEDVNKQTLMYQQYMDHAKRARAIDAQQTPQDQFADFPIDSARYGA